MAGLRETVKAARQGLIVGPRWPVVPWLAITLAPIIIGLAVRAIRVKGITDAEVSPVAMLVAGAAIVGGSKQVLAAVAARRQPEAVCPPAHASRRSGYHGDRRLICCR